MCGPHFLPLFFSSHLYHLPRFLLFRHTRVISRTLALLLLASFSTSCPSKFMDPKGKLKMGKMTKREADFESDDDELDHLAGGCAAEEDDGGVKKKKVSSAGLAKKGPWGGGAAAKGCQVEKCAADLSDSKQYHRRHKVCEHHAKAQVVLVAGIRQRFCQQCSRFHELGEFDDSKRSCRRRLAGHNERRRKSLAEPQLGEGSSRKGTGSEVRDMMCGSVDDRGRIKLSVQETARYKHFQIS